MRRLLKTLLLVAASMDSAAAATTFRVQCIGNTKTTFSSASGTESSKTEPFDAIFEVTPGVQAVMTSGSLMLQRVYPANPNSEDGMGFSADRGSLSFDKETGAFGITRFGDGRTAYGVPFMIYYETRGTCQKIASSDAFK